MHVSEEAKQIGLATARLVAASAQAGLLEKHPQLARQTVSACAVLADLEGLQRWAAQDVEYIRANGGVCDTPARSPANTVTCRCRLSRSTLLGALPGVRSASELMGSS